MNDEPQDLSEMMAGFDAMLERAEPASAPETHAEGGHTRNDGRSLLKANGWDARWSRDNGDPQGPEWVKAYGIATRVVERGGIAVLHGTRGGGKTRMASEIAKHSDHANSEPLRVASALGGSVTEQRRHSVYRTAMGFFLEVRETFGKKSTRTEADVVRSMVEPGLLVFDEIQERGESAWENRLLTHVLDARYSAERPTILIANLTAAEMQVSLGPSIMDRINETGGAIEFTWKSYRQ